MHLVQINLFSFCCLVDLFTFWFQPKYALLPHWTSLSCCPAGGDVLQTVAVCGGSYSVEGSSADTGLPLESTPLREGGPASGKSRPKAVIREHLGGQKYVLYADKLWGEWSWFHMLNASLLETPLWVVTFYYLHKNPEKLQVTYGCFSWVLTFSLQIR